MPTRECSRKSIVVQRLPQFATLERSVSKRGKGKVYVDCLQNGRGKTLASVYSVRPRSHAPVSTPLDWSELKKAIDPTRLNIETTAARIKAVGDLLGRCFRHCVLNADSHWPERKVNDCL